jgi:hypothetical protein
LIVQFKVYGLKIIWKKFMKKNYSYSS